MQLLGWAYLLLGAVVVGVILVQAARGTCELVSIRNIFVSGVLIAQVTSPAQSILRDDYGDMPLSEPFGPALTMLGWLMIFFSIFQVAYARGWFTFGLYKRLQTRFPVPGTMTLLTLSVFCLVVAAFCKLVLVYIPLFGILAGMFAFAMAGLASGMATWAWVRNMANPVAAMVMAGVVTGASALAIYQTYGRREIASVGLACLWGAYHARFRYIPLRRAAIPLVIIAAGGLWLTAAFTASRSTDTSGRGIAQTLTRLKDANVMAGVADLFSGQDAGANSMFLIEAHPEAYPYDTLHMLRFAIFQPVPRVLWEDKLIGMGSKLVEESGFTQGGKGFSFGVGLMGHIANDNPWIALPLYALIFAGLCAVFDLAARRQPDNPFVLLPMGVALGEIIGMGRGETGLFLFRSIFCMVTTYFAMSMVARVLMSFGFQIRTQEEEAAVDELEPGLGEYDRL
jgi:hypothetical protein